MSLCIADKVAELPDLPLLISTILGGQLPIEERSARSISNFTWRRRVWGAVGRHGELVAAVVQV